MSDQTKLDALTIRHRMDVIGALAALLDSPHISDRDELTIRNAVRLMRNDLDAVEAINGIEHLAREGYGPTFTQRAVMVGARAAMGTGDDSTSFRAACRALALTTSPMFRQAMETPRGAWGAQGRACPVCGATSPTPHVPGCVMVDGDGTRAHPGFKAGGALPMPTPHGPCPSCDARHAGAVHDPGCPMIQPLPSSLVDVGSFDHALKARAIMPIPKLRKFIRVVTDHHIRWESNLTGEILQYPVEWLRNKGGRAKIAADLWKFRRKRVFSG